MRRLAQTAFHLLLAATATGALAQTAPTTPTAPVEDNPVIELRQYKMVHGKRDTMIDLFERNFVDSQEALGMHILGTFRDVDDPNRFTWIRSFDHFSGREKQLTDFYYGPVWQAHKNEANPLLDDNDNVLLLKPARSGSGLQPSTTPRAAIGATPRAGGMVVATIFYLWKDPAEGFGTFFADKLAPAYAAHGMPVLGSYVTETKPNAFPRLPVRQHEKVFVWFTRVPDEAAYRSATAGLSTDAAWRALQPALQDYQERPPQVLRLAPTPRSLMR